MQNNNSKHAAIIREIEKRKARNIIIRRGDYDGMRVYVQTIFKHHYRKKYREAWWHALIFHALMDIYNGRNDRLVIEEPPRQGKTEFCVRMFASYIQGIDPTKKIQYSTYGASLSIVVSGETKDIMESNIYREIFDISFNNKLNLKEHWRLSPGDGGFLGTSVGGSIIGLGANISIGDDLIKAVEAHSKTVRDAAYNYYSSSMLSRLEGIKAVVLIMQRLHPDDIVGRVLRDDKLKADGGMWELISLPLINSFEQFHNFYMWVKRANSDLHVYHADDEMCDECITDAEIKEIRESLSCELEQKEYKRLFYIKAREIYLRTHTLESDFIRYRDIEVERPPLTPLDELEYGLDFAISQMRSMSLSDFKKQYFQDAEIEEAGHFSKDDFTYITDIEIPDQYEYIIVDNAESEEASADDRGVVVVGKSMGKNKVVKTVVMNGAFGKWNVYGTCGQIINMMIKFPDAPVLIEGAGGGITLNTVLKTQVMIYNEEAKSQGKKVLSNQIVSFKPDNQTSKNSVINIMTAPLEQHELVFFKYMDQKFKEQLEKEFKKYNPEKKNNTDNCIDPISKSFVLQRCVAKSPKKEEIRVPRGRKKSIKRTWKGI